MNIVYYGGHQWDGPWFRKQQIASRLSQRGHRVYYIEDTISAFRKKNNHKNKYLKTQVKILNENLKIIIPSTFFAFPRKYYPRHIYNLKLLNDILRILKKDNVEKFVLFFNRLEFSTVVKKVNAYKIVDICDDLPLYAKLEGDESAYKNMHKFLLTALSNSDLGIVSAHRIKEKYQQYLEKQLIIIPNGHSIKINEGLTDVHLDKFAKIKTPIIGFLGTLFKFTDSELIEYIIKNRPNYSFVFIGGIEKGYPIERMQQFQNVYHLGKVPKEEVPQYIQKFDVCINPFNNHEVNESVNPVKVFEYLAIKKHVVSTKMYSLEKENIGKYIHFAETYNEFLKIIDEIVDSGNFVNNIPHDIIDEYNWDNLFDVLISKINGELNISI